MEGIAIVKDETIKSLQQELTDLKDGSHGLVNLTVKEIELLTSIAATSSSINWKSAFRRDSINKAKFF